MLKDASLNCLVQNLPEQSARQRQFRRYKLRELSLKLKRSNKPDSQEGIKNLALTAKEGL